MREADDVLKIKKNAGFTLMELIIVIAVLAMLIGMLLPRFSNYTDKAIGTAVGVDVKNILAVGTAHNLDNTALITLADLQNETGIDGTNVRGKALRFLIPVGGTTARKNKFLYSYTRGGVQVLVTINLGLSKMDYNIKGSDGSNFDTTKSTTVNPKTQAGRIAKGLGF